MSDPRIFVDGKEIGRVDAEPFVRLPDGEVTIDLTFKPNWPGLWHLMALAADKDPPSWSETS